MANRREVLARYNASEKRRANSARYSASPNGRAARARNDAIQNARRIYIGRHYAGRTTADKAAVINAHIRTRVQQYLHREE